MAWNTVATLAGLGDTSAASLVNTPGTATRTAISNQFGPLVAAQMANDSTIAAAAVAKMSEAAVQNAAVQAAAFAKRELVTGEDINALRTPGIYTVPSTTVAGSLINWPAAGYTGALIVGKSSAGNFTTQDVLALTSTTQPPTRYARVTRSIDNTGWTPWGAGQWPQAVIPAATNLDTFRTAGVWTHTTGTGLTGLPAGVTGPMVLENLVVTTSNVAEQRLTTADRSFWRVANASAGWGGIAWKESGAGGGSTPAPIVTSTDIGLTNRLLVEDWSRRRGGRKILDRGAFSFRADHGLADFNTKIRPLLEARNIPYALALCSGQWDRTENVGVTAAMVNGWVQGGLCEIWNHTKDHSSGDNTEAQWQAAILDGLSELRTQIPAAQIDGFVIPGSVGTNFGGFVNGASVQEFYGTAGGHVILGSHAVSNGYISGTARRVLDGTVRQGQGHLTLDTMTVAAFQAQLDLAASEKSGLQVMVHPTRLDTAGYLTTADFTAMLDAVVSKRTAGQVATLGQYDLLLADTSAARAA